MTQSTETRTMTLTHAGATGIVTAMVGREIPVIAEAASGQQDLSEVIRHTRILAAAGAILRIRVQIHLGTEIIREYVYEVTHEATHTWGPPPEHPPLAYVPAGAQVRIAVTPNPRLPARILEQIFARLNWAVAEPLTLSANARRETYGAFATAGYAMTRTLVSDPRYDRPAEVEERIFTRRSK